jgi:hypothetical protein
MAKRGPGHTEIGQQMCPACGFLVDTASNMEGTRTPDPGDLSLCVNCGQPAVFDAMLQLRPMTTDEFLRLPPDLKRQITIAVIYCEHVRGPLEPKTKPN